MYYEVKVYEKKSNFEAIHTIQAEKVVFNKNGGIDIFECGEVVPIFPCLEKDTIEVSIKIVKNSLEK